MRTWLLVLAACGGGVPDQPVHTIPVKTHVPDERVEPEPAPPPVEVRETWWGTLVMPVDLVDIVVHLTLRPDGASATLDVPAAKATDIPLSDVEVTPQAIRFKLQKRAPYPPERYAFTRAAGAAEADGFMELGGALFHARLVRQAPGAPARVPIARPQTPLPPYPYNVREVSIEAPEDGVLAGSLSLPAGAGPFPAVLLISGSGQQDRDETIYGHRPFRVLADRLTRAGFAVLRTDDRGVGGTTGKLGSIETDIGDGRAAFEWLMKQPEIDRKRVGVIGHSLGAVVAPAIAARTGKVAFVVALAGPGVPGWELVPLQLEAMMDATGVKPEVAKRMAAAQRAVGKAIVGGKPAAVKAALRASIVEGATATGQPVPDDATLDAIVASKLPEVTDPWTVSFFKTDPRPLWRKVRCPVLALVGDKDVQVPAAINLREIAAALAKGKNKDVTTTTLPGLNHLYQNAETGAIDEYGRLEETFDIDALALIERWLLERAGR
jgi:pimeloyl-ACP methyl ester carboxylesterase